MTVPFSASRALLQLRPPLHPLAPVHRDTFAKQHPALAKAAMAMVNVATPSAETAAQAIVGTETLSATTAIAMVVGADRANQIRQSLNAAEYVVNAFQRLTVATSVLHVRNSAPGEIGARESWRPGK